MICGYVASAQQPWIEDFFTAENPHAKEFFFRRSKFVGWFLVGERDKVICDDGNLLLLVDRVPVFSTSPYSYCTWDKTEENLREQIKEKGFPGILEQIVSNVNSIFFNANKGELWLASNRAAAGRIYYRYIPRGLAFSNNFLCLMRMSQLNVNYEAVYAIIKYGAPPDPITISKDIFSIPAGHYSVCSIPRLNISIYPYFRFEFSQKHDGNMETVKNYLLGSARLLGSLKASILLSGGIDSTLYAHLLCENTDNEIRAFYLCFGKNDPQIPFAEKAAAESGCSLEVIEMKDEDAVSSIVEAAEIYTHPFSDYSTIPTYYLMRRIQDRIGDGILIDGTGGDACFGFGTLLHANKWVRAYNIPLSVKKVLRELYSASGVWKNNYSFVIFFKAFAACCESDIALSPLVLCPESGLFNEGCISKINITKYFMKFLKSITEQGKGTLPFEEAIATVGDIAHTCSNIYTAKTYEVPFDGKIQVVYPYLWRDILVEQGNISWAIKIRNGIVKWPLKSLLEKYMTKDFIYRKKSAFLPPLEHWLMREDVYELLRETLVDRETIIGKVVCQKNLSRLVKQLPRLRNFSLSLFHFLWGTLFTELWLRRNLENNLNTSHTSALAILREC
jgi:asparagine synthase (glutamine-hydrolysing)